MPHQSQGKMVWMSNPKLAIATEVANARHRSPSPPVSPSQRFISASSSPPSKRLRLSDPESSTVSTDPSTLPTTTTTSIPTTLTTPISTPTITDTKTSTLPTLHAWLHPDEPPPLITNSPPLHFSTSTFAAFSLSFLPATHITSEPPLAKQARRMVRELDVCGIMGQELFKADEGAFQSGEGRAQGKRGEKGIAREPDHRMWAVRTLCLKDGRNGTRGADDYHLLESSNDDGEKFGGERILRVLRENKAVDVLTVCCRWYGGDMIGPIRFQHMATTCQTSTTALLKLITLRDLRTALEVLDEEIASMRATINPPGTAPASQDKPKTGFYDDVVDVAKLQRLVGAREKTKASLETKVGWAAMEQAKADSEAALPHEGEMK